MTDEAPILIAGAGPTGLVAALALARQGVPVVVLEAEAELPATLRATTFHPPTLDMLETLGAAGEVLALGHVSPNWQFRDRERGKIAEFDLSPVALEGSIFRMLRQGQRVVFDLDESGRATHLRLGSEIDMGTPSRARVPTCAAAILSLIQFLNAFNRSRDLAASS